LLAEKLGFVHLNTGLLYRAVGYLALKENVDRNDEVALGKMIARHRISLAMKGDTLAVLLDGTDIASELQSPEVSESTSMVSRFAVVRTALMELQRTACPGRAIVAEGRDLGTVVFPDAPLKFFVTADEAVRVERRLQQLLQAAGKERSDMAARAELEGKIGKEIAERDQRDTQRSVAPTLAASDAVVIDNSRKSLEEIVAELVTHARSRGL
jgi:cytidylate kinase